MKMIGLEFFKLRRKRLFLMISLFLCVELAWAFMASSMSMSRNPDNAGWEVLIMLLASMNGLFLPIISAVVASRICDMEYKGSTWKLLMAASVKRSHIYAAKYSCACILMLFAILLQFLAMLGFGVMHGFEPSIPFVLLIRFWGGTMITTMVIIALQQWISLAVKNQAFGLCLGMIGGFIGITVDFFPAVVRRLFIWSYYTGLSPVASHYADNTMELVVRDIGASLPLTLVIMGAVVYFAGSIHVSRQDV
ncbi:ABC transporter permease [Paenibacillus radicis (ex Gao et al. 2016)]|uniref:Multidrug ABC transporter permease n=1 Tax=Paenibacillus radicis (ex Gao et al. 2016) TaxID=1737354 RepID=A0A917MAQ8_9BACL|nr:ABC transporter permease [Paenibacillus radicis (ex Gao et al. 2016)]GGG88512.1 multidrug ABC transporter permease [Paenibacillus radicis (ex Gao et al. 2016)]